MSWYKTAQSPPKVTVLSYVGELLSVLIGNTKYQYYANPTIYKKIEFYIKNGWYGKALKIINQLEKL